MRGKGGVLVELDLSAGAVEAIPRDPLGRALTMRKPVLSEIVAGLRRAAEDDSVRALVAKVGDAQLGLGRVQELREAVLAFGEGGKPTVGWAETFGEFGPGTLPYYLATAFGEIWLQPSGDVGMVGPAIEATFLRDALDRAGVRVEVGKRAEYKNAPDLLLERGFTDAHREAVSRIAASSAEQLVDAVASARGLKVEQVLELIDRAPLRAAEALQAGLVDRLGYRDEVYADVRRRAGGDVRLLFLSRYARTGAGQRLQALRRRRRPAVALVQGTGAIRLGRSGRSPLAGTAMGADTVSGSLRAAVRDENVRAIVFRVDSGGGSYVASDTIWRETIVARRAGKPVVVSMGDVAASGGYFVAMAADAIVAHPGTLTGSIGVFAGKPVLDELLGRLGVTVDAVETGRHARMFSPRRPFSDDERALLERWLDHVYEDFTGKVAECRRLPIEHVREVARGRVWTGADAKERGLVDELGGLGRAVALARGRAGLPDDAPVRVFPRAGALDRLRPPQSSEDPRATAQALFAEGWGPVAALAARAGLPAAGPLALPVDLRIR